MARILIAEDDDIVAAILSNALVDAGHAVGVLANGADAFAAIRKKRPDLVVLDCDLPEMKGVLVVERMRCDINLWRIPVLMLTGCRSREDEEIAMFAGANGYLRKPFDPEYVLFRIDEELTARAANEPRTVPRYLA